MTHLLCTRTGETRPHSATDFRSAGGFPMEVIHDPVRVDRGLFDGRLGKAPFPYNSGVWRFRELVYPEIADEHVVSWPEGNTPLYHNPRLSKLTGLDQLWFKHEGHNPTGSFKDRGMTVAVSQARRIGAQAVVCASTGNTSAAVASYAALAGIPAVILVPEGATAVGKLSQALAYGARTLVVRGNFDDAMRLVQEASGELGLYLLNSLNPFRIEGQKAIVYEILQQLDWEPPDWIVVPAGNLGNTSAFGRALADAAVHGLITKVPRIAAVQAAGADPFYQAFQRGFDEVRPMRPETLATAIRIGDPVSVDRAIRAISYSQGVVTEVDDRAILEAKAQIDASGIGAEPASCASLAGVQRLMAEGVIKKGDRVVAVLTGHLLKDSDTTVAYHEGRLGGLHPNAPRVVDPTLHALREAISGD